MRLTLSSSRFAAKQFRQLRKLGLTHTLTLLKRLKEVRSFTLLMKDCVLLFFIIMNVRSSYFLSAYYNYQIFIVLVGNNLPHSYLEEKSGVGHVPSSVIESQDLRRETKSRSLYFQFRMIMVYIIWGNV